MSTYEDLHDLLGQISDTITLHLKSEETPTLSPEFNMAQARLMEAVHELKKQHDAYATELGKSKSAGVPDPATWLKLATADITVAETLMGMCGTMKRQLKETLDASNVHVQKAAGWKPFQPL